MVTTFAQACKATGHDPEKLPDVSMLPKKHQKSIIAFFKLIIVIEALNEGWTPDWNDRSQWKYYAWFRVKASDQKPSGVGFSGSDYDGTGTHASVGSRLCLKSPDLALHAGKYFEQLYIDYLLIP